jgi:hypothetical protein
MTHAQSNTQLTGWGTCGLVNEKGGTYAPAKQLKPQILTQLMRLWQSKKDNQMNENDEIAKELEEEKEAKLLAEFAPKKIQRTQVNAAKYAWMFVAVSIDIASAYVVFTMTTWFHALIWLIAAAGGLIFSEWLWERIGNNDEQAAISRASKTVSAIAVIVMGIFTGVAYVVGWTNYAIAEAIIVVITVSLFGFHGWQAYQYHEKDDDYINATVDAKADAQNQKEVRDIHRAGQRVAAKKFVRRTGAKYQKEYGNAFTTQAGRSYASDTDKPELPKA